MSGIVIIGAGQAGSSLAIKLRSFGLQGRNHFDWRGALCALPTPPPVKDLSFG